ncbi:hypothetical protein N2152v2_006766 [Parachlorella kessleri]
MKTFSGRACVEDPCSSPSAASTAMLASLNKFEALADWGCCDCGQAAALPNTQAPYGKQHSEGLREVQERCSLPLQQQCAVCSERAPSSPSYTAFTQVPSSPSEAAGEAAADGGTVAARRPPQVAVITPQPGADAVLLPQELQGQGVITSPPSLVVGMGMPRHSGPQERLPGSWADVSWLDGLSFPDLFAEGDFATALPPQGADPLYPQLPYPASAEAPFLESAASLVSSSSASGTPAASSPAGSLPSALPTLPFWPSTPGSERQTTTGGFPGDAGSSWVDDLAAAVQGFQPQQLQLAAVPGARFQDDGSCCRAEALPACAPVLPALPASAAPAQGCPASGPEPVAAAKGTGRKRGRPRLYDTAGAAAAATAPSSGSGASAVGDAGDSIAQQAEHGKRGRGPKPKYVFGNRVEAAGARRERNRKAALDSYYRQRQHVKELEEERDRLLAENSSLEGLLGHLQLGGNATAAALWMRKRVQHQAHRLGLDNSTIAQRLQRMHFATEAVPELQAPLPEVLANWTSPRKLLRASNVEPGRPDRSRHGRASASGSSSSSRHSSAEDRSSSSSDGRSPRGLGIQQARQLRSMALPQHAVPAEHAAGGPAQHPAGTPASKRILIESTRLDAFYGWVPWPMTGITGELRWAGEDCHWNNFPRTTTLSTPARTTTSSSSSSSSSGNSTTGSNAVGLYGSIALVTLSRFPTPAHHLGRHKRRHACSYGSILAWAQGQGATAVVVAAPAGMDLEEMTCAGGEEEEGGDCEEVKIPATMVHHSVGRRLRRQLARGDQLWVEFVEEQGPGLFAGIGADGRLFEPGWQKFPTFMHLVWAAQWEDYLGRLKGRLQDEALVVPIFERQVMEGEHGVRVTVDMPGPEVIMAASRLEVDMELGCPGTRDADCPVWDHAVQLFVCCQDGSGQLPDTCDPCQTTVWGSASGSSSINSPIANRGLVPGAVSRGPRAAIAGSKSREDGRQGDSHESSMGAGENATVVAGEQPGEPPALRCGRELARWMTPFRRRIGRWVTDVTHSRALLASPRCTFTMQSTPWAGTWLPSLRLRVSPPPPAGADALIVPATPSGPTSAGHAAAQVAPSMAAASDTPPAWPPRFLPQVGAAGLSAAEPVEAPALAQQHQQQHQHQQHLPLLLPQARPLPGRSPRVQVQLLPLPFNGGAFDARYNTRFGPFGFTTPEGLQKAVVVSLITGHGSDENGCAEFCPTTHHYEVNGARYSVLEGVEPNEHGTWTYGRNGWCDGQDVKPWVADITKDMRPAGGGNSLLYLGLYRAQDPNPQQPPGFIMMQANLRRVQHGVQTPRSGGARVFKKELAAGRAASDIYGLTIDLVANLAVLYRALPLVAWHVAAGKAAYLLALAGLLAWNLLARNTYVRWRSAIYTTLRLHAFVDPNSRQIWTTFVNQPPIWQKGALAEPLNFAALLASLLGQSWAGLMALFALSHAVPLWLHVPVQLACLASAATHNDSFCSSALLDNETARRLVHLLYSCMDQLLVVVPLPMWPLQPVLFPTACRRLALMKQVVVGLMLPTLLLCYLECRAWRKYCAQHDQREQASQQQQQQQQQQHKERKLTELVLLSQAAGTEYEVLTLNQTLALAKKLSFNPYVECVLNLLKPQSTSFLGPLNKLRTGDVEQAFYRFRRTDCSPAPHAAPRSSEGLQERSLLSPQLAEATLGAEAAPSVSPGGGRSSSSRGAGGGGGSWSSSTCPVEEDKGGAPQPPVAGQGGMAGAERGQPEPPPILLIPGLGAAMATWGTALLREMSCYREVILLENRGAGLSTDYAIGSLPLTYYSMADSIVQLADALNLTQPDILGWSTGGDIALILAVQHGPRFRRIVGYGAMAGSNNTVLPDWPDIFAPGNFDALSLKEQMALLFPPQDDDFKRTTCQYLGNVFWMPHSTVLVNDSVSAAQYRADVEFTTRDPTVWDALPNITNPLLVAQGGQDVLVPAANAALIAARVPGAKLLLVPDWGHAPKDATQLVAAVNEFLDPR